MTEISAKELYYLAMFAGIDKIFGIAPMRLDTSIEQSLTDKGILDIGGAINHTTVGYVEALRKYHQSTRFVQIQNYLFGVDDEGMVIVIQCNSNNNYELFWTDSLQVVGIAFSHPLVRMNAAKYYPYPEDLPEVLEHVDNVESSQLVMRAYKAGVLQSELAIAYRNRNWYRLNRQLEIVEQIPEPNIIHWIKQYLPIDKALEAMKGALRS